MKRNMIRSIALVLSVVALLLCMVSCDRTESVLNSFNKAGYEAVYYEEDSEIGALLKLGLSMSTDKKEYLDGCGFILVYEKDEEGKAGTTPIGMAICFASEENLKSYMLKKNEDGSENSEAYDAAIKECRINANCLYVTTDEDSQAVFAKHIIFKPMNFLTNAFYMGVGMLGIFVVIGLIVIATYVLNNVTAKKKEKAE